MFTHLQAVIFDMDGVIINSEDVWAKKELAFFKQFTRHWTQADHQQIIGRSLPDIYQYIINQYSPALTYDQFFKTYDQAVDQVYGHEAELMPGVIDLLKQIQASKMPLALASSAPHAWIKIILDRFKLRKYFPVVVSSEDVPQGKGKPNPAIFLLAAKKLKVKPASCLVIEDSINGVKAAKAAKMFCFWLTTNPTQNLNADKIVRSHQQINQYLNVNRKRKQN